MSAKQENWQLSDVPAPELDEGWWAAILADEEALDESNHTPSQEGGQPILDEVDWERALLIFKQDEIIDMMVYGFNRGGLLVKGDSIQGFIPLSHLITPQSVSGDGDRRSYLSQFLGKTLSVKIIECEPEKERIVLSERAAQAGEGMRKALFDTLQPGVIISGAVTNITDFGAFIDLGGVEGLVHVSEMSWGRVQHPSEHLSLGQEVEVLVLHINEGNSRIALSMKRLTPNPWEELEERYQPGDIVSAVVTNIQRFGVFARLNEGVEGLIHISSLELDSDHEELKPGQEIQVRILHIDTERRRLGLGLVMPE